MKKLDRDIFQESILWSCSVGPSPEECDDLNLGHWIDRILKEACDASAPRVYACKHRKSVHWWNTLDELRKLVIRARRRYHRMRSRRDEDATHAAYLIYKRRKAELNREIAKSKEEAWHDLLAMVDADPWGLPYRAIVKKLTSSSNMTRVLERKVLGGLLDSLFPPGEELPVIHWERDRGFIWNDEWLITPEEVKRAIKDKRKANTAPGLDGISATIIKQLPGIMIENLASCFSSCFRRGYFPDQWKTAGLVLIPKGGTVPTAAGSIPKGRPICLLSEVGKILERVLVSRLERHMSDSNIADLSPGQYGFRRGRSTCDALMYVR